MKRKSLIVLLTTLLISANSFQPWGYGIACADTGAPFSMLWFTDTQYYARSFPEIYDFLGDWMVRQYERGDFGYAVNTGDIVDNASATEQWEVADRNFRKLDDAAVPYGVLAGNHDVAINGLNYHMFFRYFGAARFRGKSWYGGSMENNRNHYDLITLGGHDFVILYLGYGTSFSGKTIKWSNSVLKKYGDRTAILAMHEYLRSDASMTPAASLVFDNIVIKNDNVRLVLCGHYHGAARSVKRVSNPDGSTRAVIEILSNYQKGPRGGDGYLRYLNFNPSAGTLNVITYSPYTDKYNFFKAGDDSFTESIRLVD